MSHLLLLLLLLGTAHASLSRVRVGASGHFVDEDGRALIFHGVNAVEKLQPFLPQQTGFDPMRSLSEIDAASLASWGFNVVRLGVMWVAVMPAPGAINHTYLAAVNQTVSMLAAHGIYTILDMHQDSMSPRFCGEGFPAWAVDQALAIAKFNVSDRRKRFPAPKRWPMDVDPATGLPSLERCREHNFFDYYATDEQTAARRAFFSSPAMHARFGDHWEAVARALGRTRGVLGYELFNEPYNANPWASDAAELQALYSALSRRIRAVDNETIVLYETHVLRGQFGDPSDFPPGGPGGAEYNDRQAYAFHIYCVNESLRVLEPFCDLAYDLGWFAAMRSQVGGGRMLTEFGAVGDSAVALDGLRAMTRDADSFLQSWAYWTYKPFDDITTSGAPGAEGFYRPDGTLQESKVAVLARPFAPVVAGLPLLSRYSDADGTFTLRYRVLRSTSSAVSRIFKHGRYHYPSGYTVAISPAGAASWKEVSDDVVEITHNVVVDPAASRAGGKVEIEIENEMEIEVLISRVPES